MSKYKISNIIIDIANMPATLQEQELDDWLRLTSVDDDAARGYKKWNKRAEEVPAPPLKPLKRIVRPTVVQFQEQQELCYLRRPSLDDTDAPHSLGIDERTMLMTADSNDVPGQGEDDYPQVSDASSALDPSDLSFRSNDASLHGSSDAYMTEYAPGLSSPDCTVRGGESVDREAVFDVKIPHPPALPFANTRRGSKASPSKMSEPKNEISPLGDTPRPPPEPAGVSRGPIGRSLSLPGSKARRGRPVPKHGRRTTITPVPVHLSLLSTMERSQISRELVSRAALRSENFIFGRRSSANATRDAAASRGALLLMLRGCGSDSRGLLSPSRRPRGRGAAGARAAPFDATASATTEARVDASCGEQPFWSTETSHSDMAIRNELRRIARVNRCIGRAMGLLPRTNKNKHP